MRQADLDTLQLLHNEAKTALVNGVPVARPRKSLAILSKMEGSVRITPIYLETFIMISVAARLTHARANGRMAVLRRVRKAEGQEGLFNAFSDFIDRSLGDVKFTGHGYSTKSLGDVDPGEVFRSIQAIVSKINDVGYSVFANSGTLLGLIRDKAPIEHDDDIDLAVILNATDDVSAAREFAELFVKLQVAGFDAVAHVNEGSIIKLPKVEGFEVDLFPAYSSERGFCVFPYSFGDLVQDDILPLKICGVSGLPVPARPERVLEVNYGTTWLIPDRRFVFPWKRQKRKFATLLAELRNVQR